MNVDPGTPPQITTLAPGPRLQLEVATSDQPAVRIGERVLGGQCLVHGEVDLHAPTSGRITGIETVPSALVVSSARPTSVAPALILEPDGLNRHVDPVPLTVAMAAPVAIERLQEHLRCMGIVGMGGAGFPAHRKLDSVAAPIQTVVVNAVECEPGVSADSALLRARADAVLSGAAIIANALGAVRCIVGISPGNDQSSNALTAGIARRTDDPFSWHCANASPHYPGGHERNLLRTVTGVNLNRSQRPTAHGLISFNVATLNAIHDAVVEGVPCLGRVISISTYSTYGAHGPGEVATRDQWVAIGTPISQLGAATRNRIGGALAGWFVDGDAAIGKTTLSVELGVEPAAPEQPCIRCQRCADVCPEDLLPERLLSHARGRDDAGLVRENLDACIECGACDPVCPSGIPLLEVFRGAKADAAAHRLAEARAQAAQERHERAQRRLANRTENDRRTRRLSRRRPSRQSGRESSRERDPEPTHRRPDDHSK